MVLIKMEKLADSELRNIAEGENIEDYMNLTREELIQALTEKYEDDNFSPEEQGDSRNFRYLSGITDYRGISDYIEELPGVEELPESYPETSIYLLNKNNSWGFAFWSISNLDRDKIESSGAALNLAVSLDKGNGNMEQYDIPIDTSDSEWNIFLSVLGGSCTAYIVAVYPNGERETLASSNTINHTNSYWMNNISEINENDSLFKVYLSLITTKEGDLINNPLVEDIVKAYEEEDRDE